MNILNEENLNKSMINAAKWSSMTEIAVKLIAPVTNMFLARILAPEAFGVVTTATMIVSFADMFSDAGFQKYIVQHEFKDKNERDQNANVAFWTNLFVSFILVFILFLLRNPLATLVGNPGLGNVIVVSSFQLILTSFSSIQLAVYRRELNFRSLFLVRIIAAVIPLLITLPLAYLGFGYWAIIIGNLSKALSDAIILTLRSDWKPKFYFNITLLIEMFSFSMWSLVEAISIWLTTWIDSFMVGMVVDQYYLGLYKNSTTMVNGLFSLVTSATKPVLFSSLSRLQNKPDELFLVFLKFQKIVSLLVLPLGAGVYLYREFATQLLLGSMWIESSGIIGLWALTSAIKIVLGDYFSEVYRAMGRPKVSFMVQIIHLAFLIPACFIAAEFGFWPLVYTRALMRFQFILTHIIMTKYIFKFSIKAIFKNVTPAVIGTLIMVLGGRFIQSLNSGLIWNISGILLCGIMYIITILMFPSIRKLIRELLITKDFAK